MNLIKIKSLSKYLDRDLIYIKKYNIMKNKIKKIVGLIALCMLPILSIGQINNEGTFIFDPYYGFPNFGKVFVNDIDNASNDVSTIGIGPMGIRAEYMLADKFGVGIDFIYNSINGTYQIDSLNFDGSIFQSYDTKLAMQRYRVQVRMNYHFVTNDRLDAYVGFGVGTNTRRFVYSTDKPNAEEYSSSGSLIPVSARIALGMRYYFNNNIGINSELGIGGPMLSVGVSVRL